MVSLGGVRSRCLVFQDTVMASAIASRRQDLGAGLMERMARQVEKEGDRNARKSGRRDLS